MPKHQLDTIGLKCHEPILKLAAKAVDIESGDVLEVSGDCPFFEDEVRKWCERLNKRILAVDAEEGKKKKITIQF